MYDYRKAMIEDIIDYIQNNYDLSDYQDYDDARDSLEDELFVVDDITGNGGMFYDNEANCCKYVGDNLKLLFEASDAYEWSIDNIKNANNPGQQCDCTIRCYLLGECLSIALGFLWENHDKS